MSVVSARIIREATPDHRAPPHSTARSGRYANVVVAVRADLAHALKLFEKGMSSTGTLREARRREYALSKGEARRAKAMRVRQRAAKRARQAAAQEQPWL